METMEKNNIGSAYYITLTAEEEKQILEVLKSRKIEQNGNGIKKLLFELLNTKNSPTVQRVARVINENPELLSAGINSVLSLIQKVKK